MEYKKREYEFPTFFIDSRENKPFTKKTEVSNPEESVVISLHYHNRFEIGICNSGKGECYIGERIYPYGPGCIQIVPPNIPHRPKTDKDVQSSWIWILFNANELISNAGIINPTEFFPIIQKAKEFGGVFSREELGNIANTIDVMSECADISDKYTNLSLTFAVGSFLTLAASFKGEPLSHNSNRANKNRLTQVIDFIAEHLDSSDLLAEDALAKKYSMSVSNFRRVFKLYCGMSPKAFILRSRMAYAEYLLRKTDLPISEISSRIGYGEVSGFNRVFKKFFLLSPGALRKIIKDEKTNKQSFNSVSDSKIELL